MPNCCKPFVLSVVLVAFVSGCAVYPAVQVAGSASTGYSAAHWADDVLPRDSIPGGEFRGDLDTMLQRRLRERLLMKGYKGVSAHVVAFNAYIVGRVPGRNCAQEIMKIGKSVEGLRSVTGKFYPLGSSVQSREDMKLLESVSTMLASSERLKDVRLRVEVIQGNVILIGITGNPEDKSAAANMPYEIAGVKKVVDYIVLKLPEKPEEPPAASETAQADAAS